MAQTRNPQAVQPHLRKCFDSISKLEFAYMAPAEGEEKVLTNDIPAMLSPEGERVSIFLKKIHENAYENVYAYDNYK